jgi:tRNA-modifying protein YgfZ
MSEAKVALLADRGVVRLSGQDATKLLQGIITSDMELLSGQRAIHAGLLTPQGKILFDFFVVRANDGFLLDTARNQAAALVKRLTMYKLRANVDIRDASSEFDLLAVWAGAGPGPAETQGTLVFPDPRLSQLGWRLLAEAQVAGKTPVAPRAIRAEASDYHAHRIALGVPEGGKDYVFGDTFPHEANFDLLNGVSFSKGCFVGQEVVSRMQHRGGARKRIVIVESDKPLQAGSAIMTGQATIGTIGSVAVTRALALVRLDRAEEAQRKGQEITAAGAAVSIRRPAYMAAPQSAGAA